MRIQRVLNNKKKIREGMEQNRSFNAEEIDKLIDDYLDCDDFETAVPEEALRKAHEIIDKNDEAWEYAEEKIKQKENKWKEQLRQMTGGDDVQAYYVDQENQVVKILDKLFTIAKAKQNGTYFDENNYDPQNALIVGLPGVGKTGVVADWAKKNHLIMFRLTAGTISPLDLGSMPTVTRRQLTREEDRLVKKFNDDPESLTDEEYERMQNSLHGIYTKMAASGLVDKLDFDPKKKVKVAGRKAVGSFLFLDELNAAKEDVQAALYKLINEHEISDSNVEGGNRKMNFMFTIAAVNPNDKASPFVKALTTAILNRFGFQEYIMVDREGVKKRLLTHFLPNMVKFANEAARVYRLTAMQLGDSMRNFRPALTTAWGQRQKIAALEDIIEKLYDKDSPFNPEGYTKGADGEIEKETPHKMAEREVLEPDKTSLKLGPEYLIPPVVSRTMETVLVHPEIDGSKDSFLRAFKEVVRDKTHCDEAKLALQGYHDPSIIKDVIANSTVDTENVKMSFLPVDKYEEFKHNRYYERDAHDDSKYTLLQDKPADWDKNFKNYYRCASTSEKLIHDKSQNEIDEFGKRI